MQDRSSKGIFLGKITAVCLSWLSFLTCFIPTALSGSLPRGTILLGTPHQRAYFYVGQSYVPGGNSSFAVKQMYVEHLVPQTISQPFPLVVIHGNGMTGTNFLNTPDGRLGWADYFLGQGYELYIVDQPSRARSPWQQNIDGPLMTFDTLIVEQRFTATQNHKLWPQAALHTQWPGNGSVGDETFDNFYASTVPSLISNLEESQKIKAAGTLLLDRIGPSIVLTHSQSGQFGWILGDAKPCDVKAIVAIEPMGPPFINAVFPPITTARPFGLTETPVMFDPPIGDASDLEVVVTSSSPTFTCFKQADPPRKLANLAHIPVLMVTSESSYHSVYDGCSADFLRQAGVQIDHIKLEEVGIRGNGHMMFMEMNNLEIAHNVVQAWLSKQDLAQKVPSCR